LKALRIAALPALPSVSATSSRLDLHLSGPKQLAGAEVCLPQHVCGFRPTFQPTSASYNELAFNNINPGPRPAIQEVSNGG